MYFKNILYKNRNMALNMSIENVKNKFEQLGIAQRILEFSVSSATVELAANAVGTAPARIAKSLSFDVSGMPTLVVVAGDAKIDNRKFKDFFKVKAKMLSAEQTKELIGHEVGGVCPFALNDGVKVYLDESLKRFETVFPAAGSSNSAIEMTIAELEQYSESLGFVDVCKVLE